MRRILCALVMAAACLAVAPASAAPDKVPCGITTTEWGNVSLNMQMPHVHQDIFDGYDGYVWVAQFTDTDGTLEKWQAYNVQGDPDWDAVIAWARPNASATWKVEHKWRNGKLHGYDPQCP